jgi:hypothetical protein
MTTIGFGDIGTRFVYRRLRLQGVFDVWVIGDPWMIGRL